MKIYAAFLCSLLLISACHVESQTNNSVKTNIIFQNDHGHVGIKSKNGKVLVEPTFQNIQIFYDYGKHQLPATSDQPIPEPMEYYLVLDETNQRAIFNANGAIIIHFNRYYTLTLNEHTLTAVAGIMHKNNQLRHQLLGSDGQPLLEEEFENIAYIKGTDVIALIKEDGAQNEIYMYNPFTHSKSGPYEAFTIYDENYNPTLGIDSVEFAPLPEFFGIAVRKGGETWGLLDKNGEVVLPMEFDYIRTISQDMQTTQIAPYHQQEGVRIVLCAARKSAPSTILFYDDQLAEYKFNTLESRKSEVQKVKE